MEVAIFLDAFASFLLSPETNLHLISNLTNKKSISLPDSSSSPVASTLIWLDLPVLFLLALFFHDFLFFRLLGEIQLVLGSPVSNTLSSPHNRHPFQHLDPPHTF